MYLNYYPNHLNEPLPTFFFFRYSVGPPGYQDAVQKEFVFKLSFKNHIYFFRAESEHTYNRWLEVLRSTTQSQDFKNMSNWTGYLQAGILHKGIKNKNQISYVYLRREKNKNN